MKDHLFQIEENNKILKVIIPRSYNLLPKYKKKKLTNGYLFFLPIFVVLFYFAFIQPYQYQMDIYYSYSTVCLIYFLTPLLARIVKITPLIWEFSDSQVKLGNKIFPTKDIANISIKKHHVKKKDFLFNSCRKNGSRTK